MSFDAKADAEALEKAMKGLGLIRKIFCAAPSMLKRWKSIPLLIYHFLIFMCSFALLSPNPILHAGLKACFMLMQLLVFHKL